jgi:hypothetical protein
MRRSTVGLVFDTFRQWMAATHDVTSTLGRVHTRMSCQVLADNIKRLVETVVVASALKPMRMAVEIRAPKGSGELETVRQREIDRLNASAPNGDSSLVEKAVSIPSRPSERT